MTAGRSMLAWQEGEIKKKGAMRFLCAGDVRGNSFKGVDIYQDLPSYIF